MTYMRYEFKVVETNVGTIEIGAESYEAALEEVNDAFFMEDVVWEDGAVQITLQKEWEDK